MPEESSAADEHAIIQEITAPLSSLPDNAVPVVADVDFPIVLRGYDRLAVDAYVKRTSQLVAELQSTHSPESAVRRALERVGEEVSGILQRAHEAAAQITAQSRSDAEDRLERARQEAVQITADSKDRLKHLDAETDRIWAERQRIVEDAQDLARQLLALAESAAERFPAAEEVEGGDSVEALLDEGPFGEALAGEGRGFDESTVEEPADEPAADEQPVLGALTDAARTDEEANREGGDAGEPFDEDATAIMPPIKPEDQQGS